MLVETDAQIPNERNKPMPYAHPATAACIVYSQLTILKRTSCVPLQLQYGEFRSKPIEHSFSEIMPQ